MANLATIGLNQNSQFADLTCESPHSFNINTAPDPSRVFQAFLSGAGYAGASVLYDLPAPPFIQVPYTVAPFEVGFILAPCESS